MSGSEEQELRQRTNKGKAVLDEIDEQDRVLDDEEQEATIQALREQGASLDSRIQNQAIAYTAMSTLFHFYLWVDILWGYHHETNTPGYFDIDNSYFHLCASGLAALTQLSICACLFAAKYIPHEDYRIAHRLVQMKWKGRDVGAYVLLLATLLPSVGSYLQGDDYTRVLLWMISPAVLALALVMEDAVEDNAVKLEELEKLKYNHKGA